MAVKIYQSQVKLNQGNVPQIKGLSIPIGLAQTASAGVKSITKAIADYNKNNQDTLDDNRATEIIIDAKKKINSVIVNSKNNPNIDQVEKNLDTAFKSIDLSKESGGVKKLIKDWSNKYKIQVSGTVFKNSASKLFADTQDTQKKKLNGWAVDLSSNEPIVRATAASNLKSYFDNPNNAKYFSDFNATKNDTYALAKKLQVKFDTQNNPTKYLNEVELYKQFGELEGSQILKEAQNALLKQNVNNRNLLIQREQNEINQQVFNFSDIASRITLSQNDKSNAELLAKVPTLDNIYDYYQEDKLNEAQYEALVELYTNPNKTSDTDLITLINNQIVIAETVEEIDELHNFNSTAKEVLKDINLTDLTAINKVLAQVKSDPKKHQDYKDYLKTLKINMKDIGGALDILTGGGGITTEDKLETQSAEKLFNKFFAETGNAQTAYLKTIQNFKDNVPSVLSNQVKPFNYQFTDLKQMVADNPGKNVFDIARDDLANRVKKGELSKEDLFIDLERLDMMEDIFDIRKKLGDENYVFKSPASTEFSYDNIMNQKRKEGD
tara:strand:- start:1962 stop:3617 length:1656 start_codon:yes stop_codon:yes gene_type:complete